MQFSMRLLISIFAALYPLVWLHALEQNEPPIQRVGLPGQIALLDYNISPESPDGTRIAYVIRDAEAKNSDNGGRMPGSLWICDRDLSNHRKIRDLKAVSSHNGVCTLWIDDARIAGNVGKRHAICI
jgi:hypothetical protein